VTESPVFIVGCARSGTALLRNLLRSHSRLAFPSESAFLPTLYRGFGDPRSDREARRLADRILRLRTVRTWGLLLTPDSLAHCRSYAELTSKLYREVARREGKARWGDKTPVYVLHIPTLLEIFPAAKVIHIYRDGRDVALSWIAAGFGPLNVLTAAEQWRHRVLTGRREGSRFPGSYHEVRYEAILAEPEKTMRGVCEFIGEAFEEGVLRPTPPQGVASDAEIVSGNMDKWKRHMSPTQLSLFEGVAGDLLASLGYETYGSPARRPSRLRRRLAGLDNSSRLLLRRLNPRGVSPQTFLVMSEARIRARWRDSSARSKVSRHTERGSDG
jgi:hypothetical protein